MFLNIHLSVLLKTEIRYGVKVKEKWWNLYLFLEYYFFNIKCSVASSFKKKNWFSLNVQVHIQMHAHSYCSMFPHQIKMFQAGFIECDMENIYFFFTFPEQWDSFEQV